MLTEKQLAPRENGIGGSDAAAVVGLNPWKSPLDDPHPTVSEAIMEAAEVAAGVPIHINPPKRPAGALHVRAHFHPRDKAGGCEGCPLENA